MKMTLVESSNIESVGHDPNSEILYVQFKGGGAYQYKQVSPELHQQFMESPSKGKFFHTNIKTGHPFQKVDLEELKKVLYEKEREIKIAIIGAVRDWSDEHGIELSAEREADAAARIYNSISKYLK